MPRNVAAIALLVSGCVFDAAYQSGQTTCSDGMCPSGLVCSASHVCVAPGHDAAPAAGSDAAITHDGAPPALTCGDPGALTSATPVMGSTVGRSNTVDPMCGGAFMNGPDAVYAIAINATQSLNVALTGSNVLAAYVVASCSQASCIGSAYAASSAIAVNPGAAGTYFVVVDSVLATGSGTYTLSVTVD